MGIALPIAQQAAPDLMVTVFDLFKAFWPLAVFSIFILWFYTKMYKIPTKEKMAGGVEYFEEASAKPVSYTHLDVYKRQWPDGYFCGQAWLRLFSCLTNRAKMEKTAIFADAVKKPQERGEIDAQKIDPIL